MKKLLLTGSDLAIDEAIVKRSSMNCEGVGEKKSDPNIWQIATSVVFWLTQVKAVGTNAVGVHESKDLISPGFKRLPLFVGDGEIPKNAIE